MQLSELLSHCNLSFKSSPKSLREFLSAISTAEISTQLTLSSGAATRFYQICDAVDVANAPTANGGETRAPSLFAFILRNDLYGENVRAFEYVRSSPFAAERLKGGLMVIRKECLFRRKCFFLRPKLFAVVERESETLGFGFGFFAAEIEETKVENENFSVENFDEFIE